MYRNSKPEQCACHEGLFRLNFLGAGVVIGGIGLWTMAQKQKNLLLLWLILVMPYAYFFVTYGANDNTHTEKIQPEPA